MDVLPLRVVLNRVYVHLVAGMGPEARERFETDLYAPAEGWTDFEADALAAVYAAAADEGD